MMKKNHILFLAAIYSFVLLSAFTSCKEPESTGPETRTDSLMLKVKETDLTSATLSLHTAGITYPASLTLTRNSQPFQTFSIHQPDTTLIDTALTPSTAYTWQAIWKKTETTFLKGEPVAGKTMDSTSHDFIWQIDTLGARGSILRDVVIVNDTCVWVVGAINSKANDLGDIYNAALWNGKGWKKYRFLLKGFNGFDSPHEINSIFFTTDKKLIVASGGSISFVNFNGETEFSEYLSMSIGSTKKIWGTTSSDLYFAGTRGSLTWFDGKNFHLLETGTTIDLLDIWGLNENEVWACGYNSVTLEGTLIKGNKSQFKPVDPLLPKKLRAISSIYSFNNKNMLLSAEGRLYTVPRNDISQTIQIKSNGVPLNMTARTFRTRGNGENDIITGGVRANIWHFNGSTWQTYPEIQGQYRIFYSLDYKGKLLVGVGYDLTLDDRALVVIGKR